MSSLPTALSLCSSLYLRSISGHYPQSTICSSLYLWTISGQPATYPPPFLQIQIKGDQEQQSGQFIIIIPLERSLSPPADLPLHCSTRAVCITYQFFTLVTFLTHSPFPASLLPFSHISTSLPFTISSPQDKSPSRLQAKVSVFQDGASLA